MEMEDLFEEVEEVPKVERFGGLGVQPVWDNEGIKRMLMEINRTKTKKAAVSTTKFIKVFHNGENKDIFIDRIKRSVRDPDDEDLYKEAYRVVAEIRRKIFDNAGKVGIVLDKQETGVRNKNLGTFYVAIESGPETEKAYSGTITLE